jgi:hypothetical protein
MDTLAVGKRLAELCRQNKNVDAVDELYDKNVVSLEAMAHPPMQARTEGIDAVRKKNQWWLDKHDIHSVQVAGPFPFCDRFFIQMKVDVTPREGPRAGKRMQGE